MLVEWLFAGALGYLLGSIPFGYLAGRLKGIDIRQYGSGATGGTNVTRVLGLGWGVTAGLLDLLKGLAAAYLGLRLGGDWGYAFGGIGAAVGHAYPVWLGFRGGKSVATGAGAVLLRHPGPVGVGLLVALACILPTRYISLGSIVGTTVVCSYLVATGPLPTKALALGVGLVILWRHRSNMQRLLTGTERRFGERVIPEPRQAAER
ncbi:MAG: glycerol-3-phosphate 1-O-acyltransferase PlsY [Bacillota bacterium]